MTPACTPAPLTASPPPYRAGGSRYDPAAATVTRGLERLQRAADRRVLRADLARRYTEQGQSIHQIGRAIGRSYGFVRLLLIEADVPMRSRGGNTRRYR